MGLLDGKVAVVSGAARGQGRAHSVALAREGASIVAFDLCDKLATTLTPGATEADLAETQRLVEEQDQRCLTARADARDLSAVTALAESAMGLFGRIDILVVNHGMWTTAENSWVLEEPEWQETIDVILSGAWKVSKAFIPKIIEGERGGAIVLTGSVTGVAPLPGSIAYSAAKAGVIHMMRVLAWELGPYDVRVNAVNPGPIQTPMLTDGGTAEKAIELHPRFMNTDRSLLPIEGQPPESISDAILWLVSDAAAYVTGVALPVDAGWTNY